MSNLTTDLTDRLANTNETGLDPGLLVPLLRLLVDGDPVTIEQLASAAGRNVEDVRRGLAAVPDTEYDDLGRIIGQGLTLRPTSHRFTVAGEELYTWCALDTLIFPALLERSARVDSTSPASGDTIRVTVDPAAGVTSVEPATAVVSLVNPDQITSIRSSFCNQVHYFTSPEDAARLREFRASSARSGPRGSRQLRRGLSHPRRARRTCPPVAGRWAAVARGSARLGVGRTVGTVR